MFKISVQESLGTLSGQLQLILGFEHVRPYWFGLHKLPEPDQQGWSYVEYVSLFIKHHNKYSLYITSIP